MKFLLFFAFLIGLSACAGQPTPETADLPTLAALPTLTPTDTPTPVTPSATPSATLTASPTPTASVTVTPSATITDTPTPTATHTPTATDTPPPTADNESLMALALLAAQATVLPQQVYLSPTPPFVLPTQPPGSVTTCPILPAGGFGLVFAADPAIAQQIGCPVGQPPVTTTAASAYQNFERGAMMWLAGPPAAVYVLFADGRFQRYDDTYQVETDPISGGEAPPPGLAEPVRGFGKVWRTYPEVRNGLGWARDAEAGGTATLQVFERGLMLDLPQRGDILVLANAAGSAISGTWRAVMGRY